MEAIIAKMNCIDVWMILLHDLDFATDIFFLYSLKQLYNNCTNHESPSDPHHQCSNAQNLSSLYQANFVFLLLLPGILWLCLQPWFYENSKFEIIRKISEAPAKTVDICAPTVLSCFKIIDEKLQWMKNPAMFLLWVIINIVICFLKFIIYILAPVTLFLTSAATWITLTFSIAFSQERLILLREEFHPSPLVINCIFFFLYSFPHFVCQIVYFTNFGASAFAIVSMTFTVYKVLSAFGFRCYLQFFGPVHQNVSQQVPVVVAEAGTPVEHAKRHSGSALNADLATDAAAGIAAAARLVLLGDGSSKP